MKNSKLCVMYPCLLGGERKCEEMVYEFVIDWHVSVIGKVKLY